MEDHVREYLGKFDICKSLCPHGVQLLLLRKPAGDIGRPLPLVYDAHQLSLQSWMHLLEAHELVYVSSD